MNVEVIGYLAAFCSIIWSLPQTVRSIRTKLLGDISPETTIIFLCSMIISTVFAFRIHSNPVILTNVIGILIFIPLTFLRIQVDFKKNIKKIPIPLAITGTLIGIVPTDALGYTAGAINWWSVIIQINRCYQTRSVDDISLMSINIRVLGLILWTIYNYNIWIIPLLVSSIISLFLGLILIFMKITYQKQNKNSN